MKQGIRILIVSLTLFIATTVGASAFSDTVNKDFIQESVNELKERVISDGYYAGYYTISDYEIYDNAKESGHIGVGDYGDLMFIYYYHENDELAERVEMDFELPYISYIQPEISIYYESPYYMVADANFDASKYEWDDIVSFTQTDGPSFEKTFVNEECSDRLYDALAFWNGMLLEKADLCLANIGFTSLCNKHDTDFINVKAATCTNDGYTGDEMCFICGEIVNTGEVVSAGHSIIIDKAVAATCEATGLTEGSHCSRCDFRVAQEVIPATGHTEVVDKAVSATCEATGLTEGKHCSVCNKVLVAQKTVPALGHNYISEVTKTSTCEENGVTKYTCTRDASHTYTESIPAIGHKWDEGTVTTNPECEVDGVKTYVCQHDSNHTYTEDIPALGHNWSEELTVDTPAKVKAEGSKSIHCTACDAINEETIVTIPALKAPTISATTYTFNNKVKTPTVKVTDIEGKLLKKGTDYDVKYATGRKAVGKYVVTITFKGDYAGKATPLFKINPAKPTNVKMTTGKNQFTVKWSKPTLAYRNQITGYEVKYALTSAKLKNAKPVVVKGNSVISKTIKNLKAKKKYFVQVRSYKTVKGVKYYSDWTNAKVVTTK